MHDGNHGAYSRHTRRTRLAAENAVVTLQRERSNAWIALYRAVGGGWARPDMPSA